MEKDVEKDVEKNMEKEVKQETVPENKPLDRCTLWWSITSEDLWHSKKAQADRPYAWLSLEDFDVHHSYEEYLVHETRI